MCWANLQPAGARLSDNPLSRDQWRSSLGADKKKKKKGSKASKEEKIKLQATDDDTALRLRNEESITLSDPFEARFDEGL